MKEAIQSSLTQLTIYQKRYVGGFCGHNQRVGSSGRVCDFITYSPKAAVQQGIKSRTITAPNGTKYLVEQIEDRVFDTAKRLVIERVLKSAIGQENGPLLYPLLSGNL